MKSVPELTAELCREILRLQEARIPSELKGMAQVAGIIACDVVGGTLPTRYKRKALALAFEAINVAYELDEATLRHVLAEIREFGS